MSKFASASSKSSYSRKPSGPAEKVTIIVDASQVVQAVIPHRTPRAPEIRELLKSKVLCPDSKQMFYFRGETGWTNVDLDSNEAEPLLTASHSHDVFCKSSAVS